MQKRKTGIALLLIMAMLLVPMVSALAEEPVKITEVKANGKAEDPKDQTTTYLMITLSDAIDIEDLKHAEITLKGLDVGGNPVAEDIEMGELGFDKNGTEITIPIKMKAGVEKIKVGIKINGNEVEPEVPDSSNVSNKLYFDATAKEINASEFNLRIENEVSAGVIGEDESSIMFVYTDSVEKPDAIYLESRPSGAIIQDHTTLYKIEEYGDIYKLKIKNLEEKDIGQEVAVFFWCDCSLSLFC